MIILFIRFKKNENLFIFLEIIEILRNNKKYTIKIKNIDDIYR